MPAFWVPKGKAAARPDKRGMGPDTRPGRAPRPPVVLVLDATRQGVAERRWGGRHYRHGAGLRREGTGKAGEGRKEQQHAGRAL